MTLHAREACLLLLLLSFKCLAQIDPSPSPDQSRAAWEKGLCRKPAAVIWHG